MWNLIKKLVTPKSKATIEYSIDETGINQLSYGQQCSKKVYRWQDVEQVIIITTSDGPFLEDVFFIIKVMAPDAAEILCISHSEAVKIHLFDGFASLPGFNYEQVIMAMGSCTEASFLCFEKPVRAKV